MLKLSASLLAVAATVVSLDLSANESVPGLSLAQLHANVHPAVATYDAPDLQPTNSSNSADGSPNAWLCALGFLGLVVLRRTRSGPMI
jgi:predicted transcriptional regulator